MPVGLMTIDTRAILTKVENCPLPFLYSKQTATYELIT